MHEILLIKIWNKKIKMIITRVSQPRYKTRDESETGTTFSIVGLRKKKQNA